MLEPVTGLVAKLSFNEDLAVRVLSWLCKLQLVSLRD